MDVEAAVLGGVDIPVKSEHGVDPYFNLTMLESMNGWQNIWFFLSNNAAAPLPVFTGNCPIPQPNWGYELAKKDLRKLQPLCKVIQQLW
jgi:hypothetical protein